MKKLKSRKQDDFNVLRVILKVYIKQDFPKRSEQNEEKFLFLV